MGIGEAGRHPVGCGAARSGERPRDTPSRKGGSAWQRRRPKAGRRRPPRNG